MYKYLPQILVILVFLSLSEPISAQGFLNKLSKKVQDKIEKKVEKKVDDKVDEEVDKNLDKVFEGDENADKNKSARQSERMQKMMKGLGMSGKPVSIEDDYSFDSKLQMHFESYKKNGKKDSDGEFITFIDPNGKNFAYQVVNGDMKEKGQGLFIMDFENKAMIILTDEDGEKNGIVYGFDGAGALGMGLDTEDYEELEDEDVPNNIAMNPYIKKTGQTKTIKGYKCEEYRYDNPEEETKSNFWISEDVDIITRDFFGTIMKSAQYSNGMPWGFVMEAESENTKTGERSIMKVTDIDTNANKKFSMGNYKITNIGSMNIPNMEKE